MDLNGLSLGSLGLLEQMPFFPLRRPLHVSNYPPMLLHLFLFVYVLPTPFPLPFHPLITHVFC